MGDKDDRAKHPEQWQQRRGEKQQTLINRVGAVGVMVAAGVAIYVYQSISEKFKEMTDTIKVSKMNTEAIEKKAQIDAKRVGILHKRIEKNEDSINVNARLTARVDERSNINTRDIDILEIRNK